MYSCTVGVPMTVNCRAKRHRHSTECTYDCLSYLPYQLGSLNMNCG